MSLPTDDVLADEMVQLGAIRLRAAALRPPFVELLAARRAPVREGRYVADRSVHPHIEELAGAPWYLEAEVRRVARYAPAAQRLVEPLEEFVGDVASGVLRQPLAQEVAKGLELEVEVLALPHDWRCAARGAYGAAKLLGGVGAAALVAAVAVLSLGAALRACALHEAVGEEHLAVLAVELGRLPRGHGAALLHRGEDALAAGLVLGRVGGIVVVERNLEVGEVLQMRRVAARDQLFGRDALVARADHDGSAMGIVSADVQAFVAAHLLEAHPEVGLNVLHEMAKVNVAIGVREG